jgi:DNA-binding transcriptional ArsR family regulator
VDDYEVAYRLAKSVLTDTLSDLKAPLRKAYARVRELALEAEEGISRREIRESLQLPDSTVRRWLSELVELEYLAVAEAGRQGAGRVTRYRLVERGPKKNTVVGLLTPGELREKLHKKPPFAKNRQNAVAVFNS